jgi:DNA-directed RNA polymerase specialized sigma24 family protein
VFSFYLVSEVFIDVWSQADHYQGRSQVLTWILSIVRHKALSAPDAASSPDLRGRGRLTSQPAEPGPKVCGSNKLMPAA